MKSKEVVQQFIIMESGNIQLAFMTYEGFFKTTNGAFGQRDMSIVEISKEEFTRLTESI